MELVNLIFLIVGLALGACLGYLLFRTTKKAPVTESSELKIQLKLELERSAKLADDLQTLNEQVRDEREKIMRYTNENATLKANYSNLEQKLAEQKNELTQVQEKFTLEFKNLANQIFEEKSQKFTEQNKSNLDDLLKPLGEKLQQFEQKVEQTNKESVARNSALREQILTLRDLNQKMSTDAENLTKALKGDVKAQGNWGEVILESILEKSGLEKGREYFTQETHQNEDGRRLRPDVIIKLPENKNLVVDAKVSLVAYENT